MEPLLELFKSLEIGRRMTCRYPVCDAISRPKFRKPEERLQRGSISLARVGTCRQSFDPDVAQPPLDQAKSGRPLPSIFGFDGRLEFVFPFILQTFFNILVALQR